MLYLATASTAPVREAMAAGLIGQMVTPDAGNRVVPGAQWALDNGCFASTWSWPRWTTTLERYADRAAGCLWAVVPDVVADAAATDARWAQWKSVPRRLGYRVAYVAQNGCTGIPHDADAVFIGGDTDWKLGPDARTVARQAKAAGLWLHMGRVNSLRRLEYAVSIGCDSVDGTYLAFGPDVNLPNLLRWMRTLHGQAQQLDLFSA